MSKRSTPDGPPDAATDREPRPLGQLSAFEDGEFNALSERCAKDPQYDAVRLGLRRKLGTVAKAFVAGNQEREKESEPPKGGDTGQEVVPRAGFDTRTSLHRPYQFNGNRVRRIWAYITRDKKAKSRLRKVLGRDLAKDLDAAYKNAYLCVAAEHDFLEVSLRVHPDGWYDGQNLVNRVKKEGYDGLLRVLNALPGYRLQLADWKGEWRCGELTAEKLEEFFKYYVPGDHLLAVERKFPAPAGARDAVCGEGVPEHLVDELLQLVPLFRYAAWSDESDFLGLG